MSLANPATADTERWRRLRTAAWLSVGVHLIAGLAMALVLRHGLDTNTNSADRLEFLVVHRVAWQAAWLTWNLAALTILYFVICFARAHERTGLSDTLLHYAIVVCAAAVPLDLAAEGIEMAVLPDLAQPSLSAYQPLGGPTTEQFSVWNRAAIMLTGFFANGLYTLSAVLLAWSTRRVYPRWVVAAGSVVGLAGFSLSAAALAGSVMGMVVTNVVLLPAILVWQAGVAVTAGRRATVAAGL